MVRWLGVNLNLRWSGGSGGLLLSQNIFIPVLILALVLPITGDKNIVLQIRDLCDGRKGENFMSNIPRTVDGVVINSNDERDVDCVATFQTESILEKFLLRFDRLKIDCNDHLYIYDGAHDTGLPRAHITCHSTTNKVGSNGFIITRTNFVTLKYKTDSWGAGNVGFSLIITAFKNAKHSPCREGFQCDSYFCIDKDLVCDGVEHCGHGQDEDASNNCAGGGILPMLGLEAGQLIGAVGLVVLLIGGGGAAVWIWSCRMAGERENRSQLIADSYQLQGGSEYTHTNGLNTIIDRKQSGNMHLPVQGLVFRLYRQILY